MEEMAARRGPEEQLPEVEPSQVGEVARPQQGCISTKTMGKWKKASYFLAAVALLLLIGLATLLGIFLTKTECEPPPRLSNATTTFLGLASPGTAVDYLCQAPLKFPSGSPSFTVTCSEDLQWGPQEVPPCGVYSNRTCTFPNLNLTLASSPADPAGLEVKLTLDSSSPPPSLQLDIPRDENDLCELDDGLEDSTTLTSGRQDSPPLLTATTLDGEALVVVVVFESVDPRQLFEVRVRSIGYRLAVTALQNATVETVITSYPSPSTTTTAATDTAVF